VTASNGVLSPDKVGIKSVVQVCGPVHYNEDEIVPPRRGRITGYPTIKRIIFSSPGVKEKSFEISIYLYKSKIKGEL
jgi:hypothetical protein